MATGAKSAAACLAAACLCGPHLLAEAGADARTLAGSVRLPDAGGLAIGRARILRTALTPGELSAPLSFSVTLRMRDLEGLRARIASGARVPDQEMDARYLPLRGDYERVAAWLAAQGFEQTLRDRSHTSVFARGSVASVARAFGLRFARVAASDGEYTSAISAPAIPRDLAAGVLSVNGLQPQFRLRHMRPAAGPVPRDLVGGLVYVTPDNLASAYNFPKTATGAGQIIAIVGEAPILASDLSTFWSTAGVAQSPANVTTTIVDPGPSPNPDDSLIQEADLDVQWAGAMAPGAGIRLYLSDNVFNCFTQILNDIPAYPALSVVSISFADTEGSEGPDVLQAYSQSFASIAAAGISVLAGSGDSGSNPTPGKGGGFYSASEPLAVAYPASDPSITGVGGTAVDYVGGWSYSGEVVWNQLADSQSGSGGGVSSYFPKPPWQTGGAVLAGKAMRCVPDVAAMSVADLQNVTMPGYEPYSATGVGVLIFENGKAKAASGTSLACPVWAAATALVNEARSAAGKGRIGLLNPHLYALAGSSAFNDVTSGSNGAYTAQPGYDLCTGLGSPNVGNLVAALAGTEAAAASHRLVNISTRAQVGTGSGIAIAGLVVRGPGGTQKAVLVRGVGPALSAFSVAGALPHPVLSIYDSATNALIASDAGWGNAPVPGTSAFPYSYRQATADEMSSVGAFALPAGSADSAMVLNLPPGAYTVQISGQGGASGVALVEVYELDTSAPDLLVNISARCFMGTGLGVAISGFIVQGSQPAQLLIRGVGPALTGFGLAGILAQPSIALYDSKGALIASDAGWGNPPVAGTPVAGVAVRQASAADMSSVGAFALSAGSADSAMVVTLPPGSYTTVVSGVGGATGIGLAEVYEFSGH
ncbi:MAG TPA: S53 family peptidase [Candidatus Sulfotelmatobacter sp.]|nr:S53 family peptidase [Candidatus Sulfotelmatobacter sp.]